MKLDYWILDKDHRPVRVHSVEEWGRFFESADRIVAKTYFEPGIQVSTVFIGIDHRFTGKGPPVLFETMVFGLDMEDHGSMQWRYSSWDDAVTGHAAAVRQVKKLIVKAGQTVRETKRATNEC